MVGGGESKNAIDRVSKTGPQSPQTSVTHVNFIIHYLSSIYCFSSLFQKLPHGVTNVAYFTEFAYYFVTLAIERSRTLTIELCSYAKLSYNFLHNCMLVVILELNFVFLAILYLGFFFFRFWLLYLLTLLILGWSRQIYNI